MTLAQVARAVGIKQQTPHRWKKFDSQLPSEKAAVAKSDGSDLERLMAI